MARKNAKVFLLEKHFKLMYNEINVQCSMFNVKRSLSMCYNFI
jgi:hypothetical protein